jgi:hypothetical protein
MRFEKASSKGLVNKRFKLGDGAITITRADDLDVTYLERTVWFRRDKPDPPDSEDGHCLLTFLERLVEIRDDSSVLTLKFADKIEQRWRGTHQLIWSR